MVRFAQTVDSHPAGILRWFQTRIFNGLLRASVRWFRPQTRWPRGFHSTRNLTAIIYLMNGELPT